MDRLRMDYLLVRVCDISVTDLNAKRTSHSESKLYQARLDFILGRYSCILGRYLLWYFRSLQATSILEPEICAPVLLCLKLTEGTRHRYSDFKQVKCSKLGFNRLCTGPPPNLLPSHRL